MQIQYIDGGDGRTGTVIVTFNSRSRIYEVAAGKIPSARIRKDFADAFSDTVKEAVAACKRTEAFRKARKKNEVHVKTIRETLRRRWGAPAGETCQIRIPVELKARAERAAAAAGIDFRTYFRELLDKNLPK